VLISLNLEYFDCFVGRAGCESPAVVVQDGVVDHVIVTRVGYYLRHCWSVVVRIECCDMEMLPQGVPGDLGIEVYHDFLAYWADSRT
jgi:hypothetical protein